MLRKDLTSLIGTFTSDLRSDPNRMFIVDSNGRREISSGQFIRIMDTYVHLMGSKGVRQGDVVAIRLDRKAEQMASILACLSYGCVYVPVNPDYPKERASKIYESCHPSLTIDDAFVQEAESLIDVPEHVPNDINDTEPGMIYYTSGTTGTPRGILHARALVPRGVDLFAHQAPSDDQGNVLSFIDSMFVLSMGEWMLSMAIKKPLHIVDKSIVMDIDALRGYITDKHITHAFMTPTLLKSIGNGTALSVALIGGEKPGSLSALKDIHIINIIGSTECPVVAIGHVLDTDAEVTVNIPCNPDSKVFLSEGDRGEILLRIKRTMIRYMDSDGTDGKYVDEPDTGFSLFHSGDYGKMTANGIVVIGRMDSMVKINGQRVEPAETEYEMSKIDGIDEAVVKAFNDDGVSYLCGYYTSSSGIPESGVRDALKDVLPGYMIPAFISRLESFPRNHRGKIDRASLESLRVVESSCVPPENDIQRIMCDAFSKALKIGPVGIDDDFTKMGGNSISAIQMAAICKRSDVHLEPNVILMEGTVRNMSLRIQGIEHDPFSGHLDDIGAFVEPYIVACDADHLRQDCRILLDSSKGVSTDRLQKAVDTVTDHHDMLRMIHDGEYRIRPSGTSVCTVSEIECDTSSLESLMDDVCSSLSVEDGITMSCSVIREASKGIDRILIAIDPSVADRRSLSTVVGDIISVYSGPTSGDAVPTIRRSMSFGTWMGIVKRYGFSDNVSEYWRSMHEVVLSSAHDDRPIYRNVSDTCGSKRIHLPSTPYRFDDRTMALTVLLMAYHRSTGKASIVLRMSGSGRSIADVDRTVGQFSNHYPLVLSMKESTVSTTYGVLRSLLGTPGGGMGYSMLGYHELPNSSFEERGIDVPDSDDLSVSSLVRRSAFSISIDGSISMDLIGSDGTYDVCCTDETFMECFVSCASDLNNALVNGYVFECPCASNVSNTIITSSFFWNMSIPLPQHASREHILSIVESILVAHPILRGRLVQRDGENWTLTDRSVEDVCVEGDEFPNEFDIRDRFVEFLVPRGGSGTLSYCIHHVAFDAPSLTVLERDLHTIINGGTVQTETALADSSYRIKMQNSMDMVEDAIGYYRECALKCKNYTNVIKPDIHIKFGKEAIHYDMDSLDPFVRDLGIFKSSLFIGAVVLVVLNEIGADGALIRCTYNQRMFGVHNDSVGPFVCSIYMYADTNHALVRDYLLGIHKGLLIASKYYDVCNRPEVYSIISDNLSASVNYGPGASGRSNIPQVYDKPYYIERDPPAWNKNLSFTLLYDFGTHCIFSGTLPFDIETSKRVVSRIKDVISRMPFVRSMEELRRK